MTESPVPSAARYSKLRWLLMLASIALVLLMSWTHVLDQPAAGYLDSALKRTLITFAVARALNGSISMLQDADVSVTPAGVGVTLSPGELLDPINDLIEQFSSILLLASISLGVQKILLSMSGGMWVSVLMSAVLLIVLWSRWRAWPARWKPLLWRVSAILLLLRFFVPAYALASHALDRYFLEPRFDEASAALELSRSAVDAAAAEPASSVPPVEAGLGERVAGWFQEAGASLDVRARVGELREKLGAVSEHIVTLCVVFLLQSVLLPLLFLSMAGFALRSLWAYGSVPAE
jgi:hypothetical protein